MFNVHFHRKKKKKKKDYIQQLKNINALHPGALEEFEGISSERRNNTDIGQAIDLVGKQTYMKSAKTRGKYYHLSRETIVKYLIWFHLVTWSPKFTWRIYLFQYVLSFSFFIYADYFAEIFYRSCYVKYVRYRDNINLYV